MRYDTRGALAHAQSLMDGNGHNDPLTATDLDSSSSDLARRARILRSLRKSRAMLQETRNRTAELQEALERFKQRRSKIAIEKVLKY
ncbi:MAG TPA: hypothetical protein VFN13_04750 [Rudaea sp.]|nr:hypothetical protein [Rudaea sp.]